MRAGAPDAFFTYARARYTILLKRRAGQPWPWTDDPVLRKYKFTNVFREDDRTTVWFRSFVRNPMRNDPSVLLATVLFRWFNRTEVGEVIFFQPTLNGQTPWELFRDTGDAGAIRGALRSVFPRGPYVTAAYMLHSNPGMDKLAGITHYCEQFYKMSACRSIALHWMQQPCSYLQVFVEWMQQFDGQGPFTAYEVACDLYYTAVLCRAHDANTWANLGPGARRGLNRIHGRTRGGLHPKPWGSPVTEERALEEMRALLEASRLEEYWPSGWPRWDMRTVEHTLCEFDKYCRALNGEGEPKQLYRRWAE